MSEKPMKWIKIEDEYPPLHRQVLFCPQSKSQLFIDYVSIDKETRNPYYTIFPFMDYTHWMPLPKPPEDELKCPLCKKWVMLYESEQSSVIRCVDCLLGIERLESSYCGEGYLETEQELINRWKSLGKVR